MVAGLWGQQGSRKACGPQGSQIIGVVRKIRPSSLIALLASDCWGSFVRGRRMAKITLAFLHDLYGNRQVFTLCHHDLRTFDGSRRVLDFNRPLAWSTLMTLYYLRVQKGLWSKKAKISIVL